MVSSVGNSLRRWFGCVVTLLAFWSLGASSHGQTVRDWNSVSGGNYASSLNWSAFNVPDTTSESARFNLNSSYNVLFGVGSTTEVSDLLVTRGEVTLAASGAAGATYNLDDDAIVDGGNLLLSQAAGPGAVQLNVSDQLNVQGGSSFFVGDGAEVTAGSIQAAVASGNATMVVSGAGSTLTAGSSLFGADGNAATLTVADGAAVTLGSVTFGDNAAAKGTFNVETGAKVATGSLTLGRTGGQTAGALTISGTASEFTQTGSSIVRIGTSGASSSPSTLNLVSGTFTSGTGTTSIFFNGRLNISGGTYNANGNINLNSGRLLQSGGQFNLAPGKNLLASAGSANQVSFASNQSLNANDFTILGGSLTFGASVTLGGADGNGTMTIDGSSATLTVGSDVILGKGGLGLTDADGALTLRNGSIGTIGGNLLVGVGGSNLDNFTGTLTIESQASLTVGGVLTLGSSNPTIGNVQVLSGGVLHAGTTLLYADSAIHITEATADLGVLQVADQVFGALKFNSGSLRFEGDLTVGPLGLLGTNLSLASTRKLALSGTTTIAPQSTLTLDGGTLETGSLVNDDGTFDFIRGTLRITGAGGLTIAAGGPLGERLELKPDALLEAPQGIVNEGTVSGAGTLVGPFTNTSAGELRAQSGNTLFFTGGTHSNAGNVRLLGGWAEFDGPLNNVETGNIAGRGTLSTAGLINSGDIALSGGVTDVFGDVANQTTGRVIISGNADVTFWDDVTHTGSLFNVAANSSATFFGTAGFGVSGDGDVFFEADITPGASPGRETFGGNVHIGPLASLAIEIAGASRGDQYDALDIAGVAELDGTLAVSLLSGFLPTLGDAFEILAAAGGVRGTFAGEQLPALDEGLDWNLVYGANSVVLEVTAAVSPGDFDGDGVVDGHDLLAWQRNPAIGALADWEAHFGSGAANVSGGHVPEPTSAALAIAAGACGLAGVHRRRRSA